jgi:peptidoglycan/LPS O-acetylase OafA/YrhL
MLLFFAFVGFLIWGIYLVNAALRRRQQMQMQKHLLEKFASAHDFAEFMQSPAGQKYVLSFSDQATKPQNTILSSVRLGIVLLFVGPAFCAIPNSSPDLQHILWGLGMVITLLGAGFLVSAGVSYVIAKKIKSEQVN